MNFSTPPQNKWNLLSQLDARATDINGKCRQIVQLIKEAFERPSIIGANVCRLEIAESGDVYATLTSPVGNGRILQTWSHSGEYLQSELTFHREKRDQYGQPCWEPVWGLVVPLYDAAYSGTGEGALRFDLHSGFGDERNKAFAAAVSMLYGLLNGPLTSPSQ